MASRQLAVVTGASSGIGEAIARALAVDGRDLVLVARSVTDLENVAASIQEHAAGSAHVLAADLTSAEGVATVEELITDREPETVVNCAGSGWRGAFADQPHDSLDALLRLDVLALAQLSRAAFSVRLRRSCLARRLPHITRRRRS
jgi:short-subunit dehydrogenase